MLIKRINEYPSGVSTLSGDDLFLIMDDPDGTKVTKRISLTELSSVISSGGSSSSSASSLSTVVFNETGSVVPKFKAIYINGGHGDLPTMALAVASGEATSSKTYGITSEAISHMSSGQVMIIGALSGINTDQFNPTAPQGNVNGSTLWLSPTTPGGFTLSKPSAPNHMVSMGTIVRTHQNEGIVEVRVQNGFEIEELHNVSISSLSNKDVLMYDSGSSLWKNTSGTIVSNPSGINGATAITNIVQISQTDYDNLTSTDPNTIYIINT